MTFMTRCQADMYNTALTWFSSRSMSQDLDAERVMESKKEVGRSQIILSMH
jgi:hypothetical protein